jgi:UDP-glucose 4-epimerase/UDP-glucuronate decarboxylase
MTRVLVTGAAGVIGFDLTRELLARGERVLALDSGKKGGLADLQALAQRSGGLLELVNFDLGREGRTKLAELGPFESIFHLAAIVGVRYVCDHPYETIEVNLRSTLDVLDLAIACRPKAVLFASSSENYASTVDAGLAQIPTPEEVLLSIADVALPRFSYAASKLAGESALFAAAPLGGFTPVVVRFHNVYGPRMGPTHVIPEFLERVRQRVDPFPIYGPEQTRSFLYSEDAARALALVLGAARAGKGGIVNVGSSQEIGIGELAHLVFDVTGFHPRVVQEQPAPPGSVRRRAPDTRKLAALGFRPQVSLREGLERCWGSS